MRLSIISTFLSVVLGLVLGLAITFFAGENPWHVFQILITSAFGSRYGWGMTLFYVTPLIFTGLSVSVAFSAGLFNIGAEGQLAVGALCAAAVGILLPDLAFPWAPMLGVLCSFIGGASWGLIAGWLRARRGSHEVIVTIMLNFIATGLCSWVTLYLLRDLGTQNPQTLPIGTGYELPAFAFFDGAPVGSALLVAVLAIFGIWFLMSKTVFGFESQAVGQSERAARTAGIDVGWVQILTMGLAGGLAGCVGVCEILGNSGAYKLGFSPGYGFMGIAVALVGGRHPLGVLLSALLFGALYRGATDLDLETEHVTRDLSQILQALIILCVSAQSIWDGFLKTKPKKTGKMRVKK